MKAITAAELKERCLSIMDNLDSDGLVITNGGQPVAKLIPLGRSGADLIGSLSRKSEL